MCEYVCAQLNLTLCNSVDRRPPGSPVHGIFQAWILEWVAISSSNWQIYFTINVKFCCSNVFAKPIKKFTVVVWSQSGGGGGGLVTQSCPTLEIPQTVACQAPPSMELSRQEYWSGLLSPSPSKQSIFS